MGVNFGDVIQLTTGGDAEVGGAVLGGFLRVFSFLKVSGLAGGRETWSWERWASGSWDLSLGEGSWVQDSSQMPKEAVGLQEVALLVQFPGSHSPRPSCNQGRCQSFLLTVLGAP